MDTNKESEVLVQSMDTKSQEFKDFQLLIKAKVENTSLDDQIWIKLTGLKYEMEDYLTQDSAEMIHTGDFLSQALSLLNIKQREFASYIDLKAPNLNKLIKGERKINIEQALIFENIFNIDAALWMGIQTKNQLNRLEKANRKLYKKYKIKDLV